MTDLAGVADRLGRAADRIEKLAAGVPLSRSAIQHGLATVLKGDTGPSYVAFATALDPHTVAALVPLLHLATGAAQSAADAPGPLADWVAYLDVFARRLLGEEETGG